MAGSAPDVTVVIQSAPLLLRAEHAAQVLALSRRAFERLSADGRLPPPITLGGRRRLWRFSDLAAFVEAGGRVIRQDEEGIA